MKVQHLIELMMLLAIIVGAFVFFHHRNRPAAYLLMEIEDVTTPGTDVANAAPSSTLLRDYDGVYLAGSKRITALDGHAPRRIIIARFGNAAEARAWYNSPEEQKLNALRLHDTNSRLFIIEGD
jgi:uncharacterized protein (DUF1330 family)